MGGDDDSDEEEEKESTVDDQTVAGGSEQDAWLWKEGSEAPAEPSSLATRTAVCSVISSIGWVIFTLILLFSSAHIYENYTLHDDRFRYTISAVERIKNDAASIMSEAFIVHDAIKYSVNRKFYFEPRDYVGARRMLEPLFAATPALRAVDLAFSNRTESISVRRLLDDPGVDAGELQGPPPVTVLVQTDSVDCLKKLGPLGCLRAESAIKRQWYELGRSLNGHSENPDDPGSLEAEFSWFSMPTFVPRAPPKHTPKMIEEEQEREASKGEKVEINTMGLTESQKKKKREEEEAKKKMKKMEGLNGGSTTEMSTNYTCRKILKCFGRRHIRWSFAPSSLVLEATYPSFRA